MKNTRQNHRFEHSATTRPKSLGCIHQLFEAQVSINPDAVAAIFNDQQLSYAELNEKANQLAHYLVNERQVKPDSLVGICVERSLAMIVAMLAVFKAGGAYVPLDPAYPQERLAYMIDDANLSTILTEKAVLSAILVPVSTAVCLDEIVENLAQRPATTLKLSKLNSSHLAYVIYTSGSTGKPKGVMIEHRSAVNLLESMQQRPGLSQSDCLLAVTSSSFDIHVLELFLPLITGAKVVIASRADAVNPAKLGQIIDSHSVSLMQATPATWKMLLDDGWQPKSSLKMLCGGEALPVQLAAALTANKQTQLWNMYGPTETTVWSSTERVECGDKPIAIGKPINNTRMYVLNENRDLASTAEPGELYIGGAGLARGYLKQPDLTAASFVTNPFHDRNDPNSSALLYKTGDLVRRLADGRLVFSGRIDHQVKIRGFRIELGEIESTIATFGNVKDVVVVACGAVDEDKQLAAYIVADGTNAGLIRDHLSSKLPQHMVPSHFVFLPKLPLTANGKIDRKALPAPDNSIVQAEFEAAQTGTESVLCEIWQTVLGLGQIGRNDHFFALGGQSLLAMKIVAQIRQRLGVNATIKHLFDAPVLADFAENLLQLEGKDTETIVKVDRNEPLLASYAQQRLWLIDQIDGGSVHYNMPAGFELSGELDIVALRLALSRIVERHESLRTGFVQKEEHRLLQVIQDNEAFDLSELDLSQRPDDLAQTIAQFEAGLFHLDSGIMMRAGLIKLDANKHVLLLVLHHIAADGWSMSLLLNELSRLYSAYSQGLDNPLQPLVIQYADYAMWQRKWLKGDVLASQIDYWRGQLAELPMVHSLPLDKPRPGVQTFNGDVVRSELNADIVGKLQRLCKDCDATLFMGLQSVFSVLLSRYSNETDIVMGSPIANRDMPEIADLIGFFVNTLVLRSDLSNDPSFSQLLERNKTMLLDAYANQQVPFEQLVEKLQPERSLSYSPLFQVMIVMQNNNEGKGVDSLELTGLKVKGVGQQSHMAKYDLVLNIVPTEQRLTLDWEFNTDLFNKKTIQGMAQHFAILLDALLDAPEKRVFTAKLLSENQIKKQLDAFKHQQPTATKRCIHELFEAQAVKHPDAVAVVFESQQLTYAELDSKANRLAEHLINCGLNTEDIVGICIECSLEMVVGMLAVLKASGAYVPLDPKYPDQRLSYMIADSKAKVILSQSQLRSKIEQLCGDNSQIVCVDQEIPATDSKRSIKATGSNLAYVIYTSGSTGRPKGVAIEHASVINLFNAFDATKPLNSNTRGSAWTAQGFDVSVYEIFTPLLCGGTLYPVPDDIRVDSQCFFAWLDDNQISSAYIPAFYLNDFKQHIANGQCNIERLLVGVEPISEVLLHEISDILEDATIINGYGPTEATICSTLFAISRQSERTAINRNTPIGKVVEGCQALVLSDKHQLVPTGVVGELCIAGAGLARGYFNNAELTEQKFIENPFATDFATNNNRLYKTGDMVRVGDDGNLAFVGRIDSQVKLRGFRIELGEIENTLKAHPEVKDVVLMVRNSSADEPCLVAYVIAGSDPLDIALLRHHLSERLPAHMVPSSFVLLQQFPLTPNGKIDRKALPAPEIVNQQSVYVAPVSDFESRLCEIWQEVLGVSRVGLEDDFFELGGHSLLAMKMVGKVRQQLQIDIAIRMVFAAPTMAAFAAQLSQLLRQADESTPSYLAMSKISRERPLQASFAQQRLWLIDQIDGGSAHYNIPDGFTLTGELDYAVLKRAFKTIIKRHESLRTCFVQNDDDQLLQCIQTADGFDITVTDLSNLTAQEQDLALQTSISKESQRLFDLSQDLMIRVSLFKQASDIHVLLVTMHHIAADGWSMYLLINELSALYRTYFEGENNPLPALEMQYADYAHWQRNWLTGLVLARQMDYWTEQLEGLPIVHNLPLDKPRPRLQTYTGSIYTSTIAPVVSDKLQRLCLDNGVSLFMGLHAAFSVLLSRYSNETDIVVGSPIANREQAEIADLIGFFLNTLVLRSDLSDQPNFTQLLNQSKRTLSDAYAHSQVPFEQLVEKLQPERSLSHSPLFQVMLVLQNNEQGKLELPGITVAEVNHTSLLSKYDLTLLIDQDTGQSGQGLALSWEYHTDLFEAKTIVAMDEHFNLLLEALLEAPEQNVFTVNMLSQAHLQQQLNRYSDVNIAFDQTQCVHQLFEAKAQSTPNAYAMEFEGEQLSYGQLNQQANRLAHFLKSERQIKPDTLVGICLERSMAQVIALLAILKSGGAYLPLDPNDPAARLEFIIQDANLATVITKQTLLEKCPISAEKALCLDDAEIVEKLKQQDTDNLNWQPLGLNADSLAFVIYTSGSTGQPKGVLQTHRTITNLILGQSLQCQINRPLRTLQFARLSFDASLHEIFTAWHNGGTLVMVSEQSKQNLAYFPHLLVNLNIERMFISPALLNCLADDLIAQNIHLDALREIVCAGDELLLTPAINTMVANHPECRLWNHYGPTETHVVLTYWEKGKEQGSLRPASPIGKPMSNTRVYIVDQHMNLVPEGVIGELLIGGDCLARSYQNLPKLTDEKFISDPFVKQSRDGSQHRLYKTGDLVRMLPDGNVLFCGRIDHQVKIRGFRVELGEIENTLAAHALVKDAVLQVKTTPDGDKRLVAYVVTNTSKGAAQTQQSLTAQWRSYLSKSLPDYMVPSAFVLLAALPINANGKVERKLLPDPDISEQQSTYVAPTTAMEKTLCEIFQSVLGLERVGILDNFFELGGHSLMAMKLVGTVRHALSKEVAIKALFEAPTPGALASQLSQSAQDTADSVIVPVTRDKPLLASYAQQRIWLIDQIEGNSAHYNITAEFSLKGTLNLAALNRAFSMIIERHESLRSCFVQQSDGQLIQIVKEKVDFKLQVHDLSTLAAEKADAGRDRVLEQSVSQTVSQVQSQGFDLKHDLMLRAGVTKLAEDEYTLLVSMHHIASDGWSMSIFIKELNELYRACCQGKDNPLKALEIQYADYAQWQRNWLRDDVLAGQVEYWTQQLDGLPVVHNLPLDKPRPKVQSFAGDLHHSKLSLDVSDRLQQYCIDKGATLFMGLHAAFAVLLSRYSNESDIVVGSPIANREQPEIADLIGFFVNALVLRSDLSGAPSFNELLEQSKTLLLDAYAHQQVPFEQLVETLQPERSFAHSPLFQVMLVLQNIETHSLDLPGVEVSPTEQQGFISKYDLTLYVERDPELEDQGLTLIWEYNTDLFEAKTIESLSDNFARLLASLLDAPGQSVFAAAMLSEQQIQQQLVQRNDTKAYHASNLCVHQLFEVQVGKKPDCTAVIFGDTGVSYEQLNRSANQLAHYLVENRQVKPDTLVGICVERSIDMMVAILAVLKAGGAYVPLDPDYPISRLAYMIEDAELSMVLTEPEIQHRTPISNAQGVCISTVLEQPSVWDLELPDLTPNHLAYVSYTSGSTGKPKGVMVEHKNVVNLLSSMSRKPGITTSDTLLAVTSTSFDIHGLELFLPLITGAKIVLASQEESHNPEILIELMETQSVTMMQATPVTWKMLLESNWRPPAGFKMLCGGEVLDAQLAANLIEQNHDVDTELWNMYGPTETTIWSCIKQIQSAEQAISIGQPIDNTTVYLLTDTMNLAPVGAVCELYIGGAGLARGYYQRDELTTERFVANPFYNAMVSGSSELLYKTGDLVKWTPDGDLVFIGRADHQMKIRGFRIELGEIENTLSRHPKVKETVLLATESDDVDKYIVCYAVTNNNNEQNLVIELRDYLSESLPDYMIPAALVLLEQLPLTANGKVDHKALPKPDFARLQDEYVAPCNDIQQQLCEIWQELLGLERVGITENFFQLGGHSLLATRMMAKIRLLYSVSLSYIELFTKPQINKISEIIAQRIDNGSFDDEQRVFKLNTDQSNDEVEEFDL